MLTFSSPADAGIRRALRLPDVNKTGQAIEFGSGTARNLAACSKKGYPSIGYDIAPWTAQRARKSFARRGINAEIRIEDVLQLSFEPNTLSVAMFGTPIYWPKSILVQYLESVWQALNVNGILHIEFPTLRDGTRESDFFKVTCEPFRETEFPNSYLHYCGYHCSIDHPGVLGTSYWEPEEVTALLRKLGDWKLIYRRTYEWQQFMGEDEPTMLRSFDRITVQKKN